MMKDTVRMLAPCTGKGRTIEVPIEARHARPAARPLDEWHEEMGAVLWWRFPVDEPPYVGSPLDTDWPGYHTHWTPIEVPAAPRAEQ